MSPPVYALEGSVAIGGAIIQWLRDNLQIISSAPESETLAKSVPDNGGIYFVPAFSGLYAPHWRSDARGCVVGMTRFVNKGHFARAAIEATAFQVDEVVTAMKKDVETTGITLGEVKVDGGMVRNKMLLQFQSDITQATIIVPEVIETTALGAAFAAGLAVGVYKDLEDIKKNWKEKERFNSKMEERARKKLIKGWNKAVQRTLDWVSDDDEEEEEQAKKQ